MSALASGSMPTVGMIGLGNLGRPMSLSLLEAGYSLVVNSLSRAEATELESRGATWADTVAEVGAASDVLITVLPGPAQVREILIGTNGALEHMKPGSVIVDMSTSSVDVAHEVMALAGPRGVSVMEAPVSFLAKAPIGASRTSASLQIFVGGERTLYDQHLSLFKALGGLPDQIYYAGPNGSGYAIKVLLNLLWFVYATGTAEVLAIAKKLGLDLRVVQTALCASPTQSNFLQYDINGVFEKGDYDEGFTLDLVCKDIALGVALGESTDIPVEMAKTAEQIHLRALETYGPKSGEMSMVKLFEAASGGEWRLPPA